MIILVHCKKKTSATEELLPLQIQFNEIQKERDRLLIDSKTDRSKLENEIALRSQCETRLESHSPLNQATARNKNNHFSEQKESFQARCVCPPKPCELSTSIKKPTTTTSLLSSEERSLLIGLFQAASQLDAGQQAWEASRTLVNSTEKRLETSEKSMQKQQRAFRKEERLFVKLDPASSQYAKAQKQNENLSQKVRHSSDEHLKVVKQLGDARKEEEDARKQYVAAVQNLKINLQTWKERFPVDADSTQSALIHSKKIK